MKKVYDFKYNILDYTSKNGLRFYLQLRRNITLIVGNSGTGKSYFTNLMIEEKTNERYNKNKVRYFDNIYIVGEELTIQELEKLESNLIIIDRGDFKRFEEDILKYMDRDIQNMYLIFSRNNHGLDITPNYYGEFVRNGSEITIRYKYNEVGWF